MSRTNRLLARMLNQAVTGRKFHGPDGMELYASISQPPIKVIDKHGTDDEMEWTVEHTQDTKLKQCLMEKISLTTSCQRLSKRVCFIEVFQYPQESR